MWGNTTLGFKFYEETTIYVQTSETIYVSLSLCKLASCLEHHAWVSREERAEAFNEYWREKCPEKIEAIKNIL